MSAPADANNRGPMPPAEPNPDSVEFSSEASCEAAKARLTEGLGTAGNLKSPPLRHLRERYDGR